MTGFAVNHKLFSNGIKKLTDSWAKCIEKKGDYIEK